MAMRDELEICPPGKLAGARNLAHKAVQLITKAATANLPAAADDSHANLGWQNGQGAFLSQPIASAGETLHVGLIIASLTLVITRAGRTVAEYPLADRSESDAGGWLDEQLIEAGLAPASPISLNYELPAAAADITLYRVGEVAEALSTLGAWFAFADAQLVDFAAAHSTIEPGPSPGRCWPHHFDIATYVALEAGDFERARGIGVGLSPGDESYGQPYFYINPWPHPAPDDLAELPAPGHWHKEGFVGAILTGDGLLSLADLETGTAGFIAEAFSISRRGLEA